MNLAEYLAEIGATYDRSLPAAKGVHAQDLLAQAAVHLTEYGRAGLLVSASGGQGNATFTPWIGWFDPDVTDSPRRGIYVVYIFREDLESVVLTLNQGMEELYDANGVMAYDLLSENAAAIRAQLSESELEGWDVRLDLQSGAKRQRGYEAGNVVCRTYALDALPSDESLRRDLAHLLGLYEKAIEVNEELLLANPGRTGHAVDRRARREPAKFTQFKPKSHEDYVAKITEQVLVKSRRHEKIVEDFGRYSERRGFEPATEHPRDLVLRLGEDQFLVEVKVLQRGNATDAVRAAVGQLLQYSHFLYQPDERPTLVALFNESVGEAYVDFLEELGIATVWFDRGWRGSASALKHRLVDSIS